MNFFEEKVRTEFDPSGTLRVGFDTGNERLSPYELAAFRLYKTLENYPIFTQDARFELQSEFTDFPDLPTLNLEVFSSVLWFLKTKKKITANEFKDKNIVPYFSRLLPNRKTTKEEKQRNIIRLKSEFLRYIRAINDYRSE